MANCLDILKEKFAVIIATLISVTSVTVVLLEVVIIVLLVTEKFEDAETALRRLTGNSVSTSTTTLTAREKASAGPTSFILSTMLSSKTSLKPSSDVSTALYTIAPVFLTTTQVSPMQLEVARSRKTTLEVLLVKSVETSLINRAAETTTAVSKLLLQTPSDYSLSLARQQSKGKTALANYTSERRMRLSTSLLHESSATHSTVSRYSEASETRLFGTSPGPVASAATSEPEESTAVSETKMIPEVPAASKHLPTATSLLETAQVSTISAATAQRMPQAA